MKHGQTKLQGVIVLTPNVYSDQRGNFSETYNRQTLEKLNLQHEFVQDNQSFSEKRGTLRGLHFQREPMAQTKLVRVLTGSIFDVAVDLRKGSPSFGKWVGVEITADNRKQVLVPKGFAHGFCTLEPNTTVFYKVDAYYSPEHDAGIRWDDPDLAIQWPVQDPVLSEKDRKLPYLKDAKVDSVYKD